MSSTGGGGGNIFKNSPICNNLESLSIKLNIPYVNPIRTGLFESVKSEGGVFHPLPS